MQFQNRCLQARYKAKKFKCVTERNDYMLGNYTEIIDLTLPITTGMDIPTGIRNKIPQVEFKLYKKADVDGIQVGFFQTPIHAGTHLDAPRHILPEGVTLDDVDLGTFVGEAYCVDVSSVQPNGEVTVAMLEPFADKIKKDGIVFLYTGWKDVWHSGILE